MTDTTYLERAIDALIALIPEEVLETEAYMAAEKRLNSEISDLEYGEPDCDRPHCDSWDCECTLPHESAAVSTIDDLLRRIRMDYDVEPLEDVLESLRKELDRE